MAVNIQDKSLSQHLHVECLTQDELKNIWDVCTEKANSMAYPSFFCSGDWLKASAENLCQEDRLLFLVVKAEDKVKALLPLVSKRNLLGGRDLRLLGTDFYPDPMGLICSPTDRALSANTIKRYLLTKPGWDRLILDWVLEDELVDWELASKPVSIQLFKSLPQSFDVLLREFNSKKRYNLRTMASKFLHAGGELVTSTDKHNHKFFLENLFYLNQKRAVEKSIVSTFEGTRIESLHRFLIEHGEQIRFYGLRLNCQLIAIIYGFEFGNRFFYYRVAHDPVYGYLSPGSVLLFLAIEDCCLRRVKEFNFLQGNENYKVFWTKESRVLYRSVLNRGNWRSRLLSGLENAKGVGKDFLELVNGA